jgi:hypothetical protein
MDGASDVVIALRGLWFEGNPVLVTLLSSFSHADGLLR